MDARTKYWAAKLCEQRKLGYVGIREKDGTVYLTDKGIVAAVKKWLKK